MFAPSKWLKKAARIKKSPFTLLEIFICIFLLTLIGGLLAIPVHSFLKRHRLILDVQALQDHLEKIHQLSLIYNGDVTVDLVIGNKGLSCQFFSDESFPFPMKNPVLLENIKAIGLDNKIIDRHKVTFYGDGRILPSGFLVLYQDAELSFSESLSLQKLKILPSKKPKLIPINPN